MGNAKKTLTVRTIIQSFVFIVLIPFLPLLITWDWGWWEGWAYALILIIGFIISRVLVATRHPDLLAERAKFAEHQDVKSWDKVLSRLVGLAGALIPLTAGLDVRDGWSASQFGLGWKLFAILVIVLGYALGTWAMMENRFFSGVVRIQKERGQHVVDSGPYSWIRHPGYTGGLLSYFATPILLDSLWTFIIVAIFTGILVYRTALEDRTLQEELPGYKEYATQKTKYRLIPGIW